MYTDSGRSFVVVTPVTSLPRLPDRVKIVAVQPDTTVSLPAHNSSINIARAGQSAEVVLAATDHSLFLYSNQPLKVFQISASASVSFVSIAVCKLSTS